MQHVRFFLRSVVVILACSSLAAIGEQPSSLDTSHNLVVPEALLPPETQRKIDKSVSHILKQTGAPSASIAVVKDGKLAYAKAYGMADAEMRTSATTAMPYSVGSISKQFTAAAVLMLAEEGKLSLDDKVSRWLPEATRANDVTLRELLSMTSGYQDFWPQDYVMPNMMQPSLPQEIVAGWAGKPLDFEPGTKWQYSNTNYVMVGVIVEQAAGMTLLDLLKKRVFVPLDMRSVLNCDAAPLPDGAPKRYQRFGLGPIRPAPKEGAGWMFGAGELAMTATDLAKWDISLFEQTILKPASYTELEREVQLKNGAGTQYGLGVGVSLVDGRRVISHGGEVSGFCTQNSIYPDEHAAIVALTNLDATAAPRNIANKIANVIFAPASGEGPLAEAKTIFSGLQRGKIDRSLFTSNANAYFSESALKDLSASLAPLGKPSDFSQTSEGKRGGMTFRRFSVHFSKKTLNISVFVVPDGKLEQYIVAAQ